MKGRVFTVRMMITVKTEDSDEDIAEYIVEVVEGHACGAVRVESLVMEEVQQDGGGDREHVGN